MPPTPALFRVLGCRPSPTGSTSPSASGAPATMPSSNSASPSPPLTFSASSFPAAGAPHSPTRSLSQSAGAAPASPARRPRPSVVWYRGHDLRVVDQPALAAAAAARGPTVAVFVLDAEPDDEWRGGCAGDASASSVGGDAVNRGYGDTAALRGDPTVLQDDEECNANPLKMGRIQRWYLHHSLVALKRELQALHVPLIVRAGDPAAVLPTIAHALDADTVYWLRRQKPRQRRVEDRVARALERGGSRCGDPAGSMGLLPPVTPAPLVGDLLVDPASVEGRFDDFHSFFGYWLRRMCEAPPARPNARLTEDAFEQAGIEWRRALDAEILRSGGSAVEELRLLTDVRGEPAEAPPLDPGKVGCTAAERALAAFVGGPKFRRFADGDARRDGIRLQEMQATSHLSPHVRFGELSIRVLFHAVVDAGGRESAGAVNCRCGGGGRSSSYANHVAHNTNDMTNNSIINIDNINNNHLIKNNNVIDADSDEAVALAASRAFLKNICLREFGYYMTSRHPEASWRPIVPEYAVFPWASDPGGALTDAWRTGTTGYPIVDAAMRQLAQEGWIHNRMRYLVAAFYCKYLLLPWSVGASYLVCALVDGDEACNSLGWQWIAGCNSDSIPSSHMVNPAATYGNGVQTVADAASYVRRYVPELARLPDQYVFEPWAASHGALRAAGVKLEPHQQRWSPPSTCVSSVSHYPTRIVYAREARVRARTAIAVMRRIFQAQKVQRCIVEDDFDPHRQSDKSVLNEDVDSCVDATKQSGGFSVYVDSLPLQRAAPAADSAAAVVTAEAAALVCDFATETRSASWVGATASSLFSGALTAGGDAEVDDPANPNADSNKRTRSRSPSPPPGSSSDGLGKKRLSKMRNPSVSAGPTASVSSALSSLTFARATDSDRARDKVAGVASEGRAGKGSFIGQEDRVCVEGQVQPRVQVQSQMQVRPRSGKHEAAEDQVEVRRSIVRARPGSPETVHLEARERALTAKRPRGASSVSPRDHGRLPPIAAPTPSTPVIAPSGPTIAPSTPLATAPRQSQSQIQREHTVMSVKSLLSPVVSGGHDLAHSAPHDRAPNETQALSQAHRRNATAAKLDALMAPASRTGSGASVMENEMKASSSAIKKTLPDIHSASPVQDTSKGSPPQSQHSQALRDGQTQRQHQRRKGPRQGREREDSRTQAETQGRSEEGHVRQQHNAVTQEAVQQTLRQPNEQSTQQPQTSFHGTSMHVPYPYAAAPGASPMAMFHAPHIGHPPAHAGSAPQGPPSILPALGWPGAATLYAPHFAPHVAPFPPSHPAAQASASAAMQLQQVKKDGESHEQLRQSQQVQLVPDQTEPQARMHQQQLQSLQSVHHLTSSLQQQQLMYHQGQQRQAELAQQQEQIRQQQQHLHQQRHQDQQRHLHQQQHQRQQHPFQLLHGQQVHAQVGGAHTHAERDPRTHAVLPSAGPSGEHSASQGPPLVSPAVHATYSVGPSPYGVLPHVMHGSGFLPHVAGFQEFRPLPPIVHAGVAATDPVADRAIPLLGGGTVGSNGAPRGSVVGMVATGGAGGVNVGINRFNPGMSAASGAGGLSTVGTGVEDGGNANGTALSAVPAPGTTNGGSSVPGWVAPVSRFERERIARRMAAMDYEDSVHGGKHREQWQAIALHLLKEYLFTDETDRQTSKDYVRLCVLKDELRSNSTLRITVNHVKELFRILNLQVTGEWDRRGHGGVRGPYVYGIRPMSERSPP